MSDQDAYRRILASLSDAMLDDNHWPAASALIDEACGLTSNALLIGEGPKDDKRVLTVGFYSRGQRREEQEREYLGVYHPVDERVPRVRRLPDSRLVHVTGLYTAAELKTSPTYNEFLLRAGHQNSSERAPGAVGGFPHQLGPRRSGGLRRLGVFPDRNDREAASPHPAVRPRPAGAGARRGAGFECDGPAGQPPDRRPPPGPARPDPGGQRPRPRHPGEGRRLVGPGWSAPCAEGRRPAPPREAGGLGAAGLGNGCGRRVDAGQPQVSGHRRWWCTSNPWPFRNRTTERGIPPRWS